MGLGWLCCFVEKLDRLGWLITANKGRMGQMDLTRRWWDRGETDER